MRGKLSFQGARSLPTSLFASVAVVVDADDVDDDTEHCEGGRKISVGYGGCAHDDYCLKSLGVDSAHVVDVLHRSSWT